MTLLSQRDSRWANKLLGFNITTLWRKFVEIFDPLVFALFRTKSTGFPSLYLEKHSSAHLALLRSSINKIGTNMSDVIIINPSPVFYSKMFFNINELKIFYSVVSFYTVKMINLLFSGKGSVEEFFHNVAMFINLFAVNSYFSVSVGGNVSSFVCLCPSRHTKMIKQERTIVNDII